MGGWRECQPGQEAPDPRLIVGFLQKMRSNADFLLTMFYRYSIAQLDGCPIAAAAQDPLRLGCAPAAGGNQPPCRRPEYPARLPRPGLTATDWRQPQPAHTPARFLRGPLHRIDLPASVRGRRVPRRHASAPWG